jgi:hypothetical protein
VPSHDGKITNKIHPVRYGITNKLKSRNQDTSSPDSTQALSRTGAVQDKVGTVPDLDLELDRMEAGTRAGGARGTETEGGALPLLRD